MADSQKILAGPVGHFLEGVGTVRLDRSGSFFDEKNNTIKHLQYTPRGYIMSLQMRNRNRLAGK